MIYYISEMEKNTVNETKETIRKAMRKLRKSMTPIDRTLASAHICKKLIHDDRVTEAINTGDAAVAVYLASAEEIDLTAFIDEMLKRGVTVAAPRWNGTSYDLARVEGLGDNDLRTGPMNILEPTRAIEVKPRDVTVWIIPGLAFTENGGRIGYGGGWYDRLLSEADERSVKIGVGYSFQVMEHIESEAHDVEIDAIVTYDPR